MQKLSPKEAKFRAEPRQTRALSWPLTTTCRMGVYPGTTVQSSGCQFTFEGIYLLVWPLCPEQQQTRCSGTGQSCSVRLSGFERSPPHGFLAVPVTRVAGGLWSGPPCAPHPFDSEGETDRPEEHRRVRRPGAVGWGSPAGLRCSFAPITWTAPHNLHSLTGSPVSQMRVQIHVTRPACLHQASQCWGRLGPVLPPLEFHSPLPSRTAHSCALLGTRGQAGVGPALLGTMPARLSDALTHDRGRADQEQRAARPGLLRSFSAGGYHCPQGHPQAPPSPGHG